MITEEDYSIPLRPCPFCKATNLLLSDDRYDHGPDDYGPPYSYYVKCWNCWATGTKTPCKYEAIAYWNGKGKRMTIDTQETENTVETWQWNVETVCIPKVSMDALDAEIGRLALKNKDLREALQGLYDAQNGPPLIKEKAAWEDAMKEAEELLKDI